MTAVFPLNFLVGSVQLPVPACAAPSGEFSALLELLLPASGSEAEEKPEEEDTQQTETALAGVAFVAPPPPPPVCEPQVAAGETAAAVVPVPVLPLPPPDAAPLEELPAPEPMLPLPDFVQAGETRRAETQLAFALRLTPAQDAPVEEPLKPTAPPAVREAAVPRAMPVAAVAPITAAEPTIMKPQVAERRAPEFTLRSTAAAPVFLPPPAEHPAAAAAEVVRPAEPVAPEAPRAVSEPVRELSLSVPNQAREGVELRVVERGGQVHVAVRSADRQLAYALRDQLGELVTRLEQGGYRAETWRADAATDPSGIAGLATQAAASGRDPNPGADHGHSLFRGRDDGRQQQQQHQQQQRPRPQWLDALERGMDAAAPDPRSVLHAYHGS